MKFMVLTLLLLLSNRAFSQLSVGIGYSMENNDIINLNKNKSYFNSPYVYNQFNTSVSYQLKKYFVNATFGYAESKGKIHSNYINYDGNHWYSYNTYYTYQTALKTNNLSFNLSLNRAFGKNPKLIHCVGLNGKINYQYKLEESDYTTSKYFHWKGNGLNSSGQPVHIDTTIYYPVNYDPFPAVKIISPFNWSAGISYNLRYTLNSNYFFEFSCFLNMRKRQNFENIIKYYYEKPKFSLRHNGFIPIYQFGLSAGYTFNKKKKNSTK
jgi:hypothetical protein